LLRFRRYFAQFPPLRIETIIPHDIQNLFPVLIDQFCTGSGQLPLWRTHKSDERCS
jgi:hypothetical protein